MKTNKKAFTLIELLVVVLIIGILAAIAVPQYQKAVSKARVAEAIIALRAITNAQEIYYLTNGNYTEEISNLDIKVDNNDKFTYNCTLNFCSATSAYRQDPILEFHLINVAEKIKNRAGKHWCHYVNSETDDKIKSMQNDICRTFGPEDTSLNWPNYFIIQ